MQYKHGDGKMEKLNKSKIEIQEKKYQFCYQAENCACRHVSAIVERPSDEEIAKRRTMKNYTPEEAAEMIADGLNVDPEQPYYSPDAVEYADELLRSSVLDGQMELDGDYNYFEGTKAKIESLLNEWKKSPFSYRRELARKLEREAAWLLGIKD